MVHVLATNFTDAKHRFYDVWISSCLLLKFGLVSQWLLYTFFESSSHQNSKTFVGVSNASKNDESPVTGRTFTICGGFCVLGDHPPIIVSRCFAPSAKH